MFWKRLASKVVSNRQWLSVLCLLGPAVALGSMRLSAQAEESDPILPPLSVRFAKDPPSTPAAPNFQRHIVALFGRLGCNGRSCHGSFQGQGGFRLSMFGYDFEQDHASLWEEGKARVNVTMPDESLILKKPTDDLIHEGGKRFDVAGWEARVLRSWIEAGAENNANQAGKLVKITVTPPSLLFQDVADAQSLRVIAHWDDGTREDVTCLSQFSSKDDGVAVVDEHGKVTATTHGDTHIIVVYDSGVEPVPVIVPSRSTPVESLHQDLATTEVDRRINDHLRARGMVPSPVCSDEEFLRRVSLDLVGTLPTPEEITDFVASPSTEKRREKIDELLERPAYALWWSTKFCDFTGLNGPLQLGTTDFGPIMAEQWRSWLERKIRDNLPYDKLVEGMVVAVSRSPEQAYEDYARQMSSYTLKKDPVDATERTTMPNYWFRGNLTTADEKALAFSYSFMGVRLDCAQCHKHPFDRWSQRDFKQFAAIFERVRWGVSPECKETYDRLRKDLGVPDQLPTAAIRRQTYWRWAAEGKVVPWPEVYIAALEKEQAPETASPKEKKEHADALPAKLLGGDEIDVEHVDDPRRPLMEWLRHPDNPYFAKALVNRFWAHYFGRGIVEPVDDLNLANPPSNPELFQYLTSSFIEHDFDMKWLHREITNSQAYQRSWRTNETNLGDDKHFSRAIIRRLPAEVVVDAMHMATANSKLNATFSEKTSGRRIGVQAAADLARTEFALAVFGKPLRTINCDCEREQAPSLAQSIFVRNDQDLHALLSRSEGWVAELSKRQDEWEAIPHDHWIQLAYLRTLSRYPRPEEIARAQRHLASTPKVDEAIQDLVWALLNTQEFITNH